MYREDGCRGDDHRPVIDIARYTSEHNELEIIEQATNGHPSQHSHVSI